MSEVNFSDAFKARFNGVVNLYGSAAVTKFVQSKVMIIGLGGVGSWIVEALARSGIGELILIDPDDVCLSNFNRQLVASQPSLGDSKAQVMAQRCKDINPEIKVTTLEQWLDTTNLTQILSDYPVDLIIDAIDNFRVKAALIAQAKLINCEIITIGSSGGKSDPQAVRVADLAKTTQDPLFAKVKSLLRQNYGYKNITPNRKFKVTAIYSEQPTARSKVELTSCVAFGSVTHLTSSYANMACYAALKYLSN